MNWCEHSTSSSHLVRVRVGAGVRVRVKLRFRARVRVPTSSSHLVRQRDYGAADALRERLRAGGVSLLDKEKLWSTLDGRRGTFATEVPTVLQAEPPADAPVEAAEAGSASGPQSAADTADGAAEPSANNPRYRGD